MVRPDCSKKWVLIFNDPKLQFCVCIKFFFRPLDGGVYLFTFLKSYLTARRTHAASASGETSQKPGFHMSRGKHALKIFIPEVALKLAYKYFFPLLSPTVSQSL